VLQFLKRNTIGSPAVWTLSVKMVQIFLCHLVEGGMNRRLTERKWLMAITATNLHIGPPYQNLKWMLYLEIWLILQLLAHPVVFPSLRMLARLECAFIAEERQNTANPSTTFLGSLKL
jgi:hypothetical protein